MTTTSSISVPAAHAAVFLREAPERARTGGQGGPTPRSPQTTFHGENPWASLHLVAAAPAARSKSTKKPQRGAM